MEVDPKKALEKSYILTSGDPDRPEPKHEVDPGWPFAPAGVEFREGRIEAFSDWLTAPENPLFARVAVNRLWQWHFGEGLHKTPERLRHAGRDARATRALLDWLAAEFVARGFRMKEIHRLIVTSDAYKLASEVDPAGRRPRSRPTRRTPTSGTSASAASRPSRSGMRSCPRPATWT